MKARIAAIWHSFASLAPFPPPSLLLSTLVVPDPKPRPLFRPAFEWWPGTSPQMSATDFERRKACRELDQAFEIRARDVRNHH